MYITYETAQYAEVDPIKPNVKSDQPLKKVPKQLPKPKFMPTKLIRISDMEIVYGFQVDEGYYALSYSWNQSGDMALHQINRKYTRIDEGKHKIFYHDLKIRRRGKKNKTIKRVKYVKFEGIIQQICLQFKIRYIWFDQMCIAQDNKEEKKREIRNMHHIYGNAYCTIALVPEYNHYQKPVIRGNEQYFKRLWTLEEAIKSKRLLFVGSNIHQWGEYISGECNIYYLVKNTLDLNVSQILHYAHQRTSTKDHDRVFALLNIFPDIIDKIDINYHQPLEDLMVRFYGYLAKKDISILFFTRSYLLLPIQKYNFLPSWTGVDGHHGLVNTTSSFQNYDVIEKKMHVTSKYVTNDQSINSENLSIVSKEDLPPPPDDIADDDNQYCHFLFIRVQISGTSKIKRIQVSDGDYNTIFKRKDYMGLISKDLQRLSRFMAIKKSNLCWCNQKSTDYQMAARIKFNTLIKDGDDPGAQYAILAEILFNFDNRNVNYYPVMKKKIQKKNTIKHVGAVE